MITTKIDSLEIAVRSLERAIAYYERRLGLPCQGREEEPDRKARTACFEVGALHLTLVAPTSTKSPVARFLAKNGEGVYDIAFATADELDSLSEAGDATGE